MRTVGPTVVYSVEGKVVVFEFDRSENRDQRRVSR